MEWNDHSKFKGTHAFLGASNFTWLGDDKEKLRKRYINFLAKERGTQLHALAEQMIKLGKRCPETTMSFDQYVNDAIAYGMEPEKLLFYSENAYGTADAILYENKFLRIHDLKTGKTPVHMEQLYVYAALFCLEYHMKPSSMTIETRLYYNDEPPMIERPQADLIIPIMEKIITGDKIIKEVKGELRIK